MIINRIGSIGANSGVIDQLIASSADDVGLVAGGSLTNYLRFGSYGTSCYCAFRFPGITFPDDCVIDSAYLTFYARGYQGTPPVCILYGEKSANPAQISSASNLTTRFANKTTQLVRIQSPTSGQWNTPSIIDIITELRGLNSYAAGAAMNFFVYKSGSSYDNAIERDYVDSTTTCAKLHIAWSR